VNTPSHLALNLALLGRSAPGALALVAFAAVLPDLPIFACYGIAKWRGIPEATIWTETYYEPLWQTLVALLHSLPLGLLGFGICWASGSTLGQVFFASFLAHALLDLPVHHSDAHQHFFPLSDYRFVSPLSYWDPKHYARYVALGEVLLVLGATPRVLGMLPFPALQGIVFAIDLLYVFGYCRFYLFASGS